MPGSSRPRKLLEAKQLTAARHDTSVRLLQIDAIQPVGRAWVANEKQRARIAKKLVEGRPDEMPDLRWVVGGGCLAVFLLAGRVRARRRGPQRQAVSEGRSGA